MTTKLDDLPVQNGFRMRGVSVSRLETFVDAAFAFGVTMLVISVGTLPESVAELRAALHRVPTFALCFVLLMMFWSGHERWSRRYGLEERTTNMLSLLFVFATLVWIYPLRMVISGGLAFMTGGWVPTEMKLTTIDELQDAFLIYAVGFGALSAILLLLHRAAFRRARELALNAFEILETRELIGGYAILLAFAGASALLTFFVRRTSSVWLGTAPGFIYCLLGIAMRIHGQRYARLRRGLTTPG